MPQTGYCTDLTCTKELTELYECHCCSWLICLKHLLEHVEVSKRDKKIQFDHLRHELTSTMYTLELMVETKSLEIENEKQLINQAKIILEKTGCTMEEMQSISEEINQAIKSNRKEETIVKVESSLSDEKMCSYNNNNATTTESFMLSHLFSTTTPTDHSNIQRSSSPTYRNVRYRMNVAENSSTLKNDHYPTEVNRALSASSMDQENINPNKKKSKNDKAKIYMNQPCPFTFDGAFGLTKAMHSIKLCPSDHIVRGNLVGHLMLKHKLQKSSARRVYQAALKGKDPRTTKLFHANDVVINKGERILCPFHNTRIHFIDCCPTQSSRIPCQVKPIENLYLVSHLKGHHRLTAEVARQIAQNYREKLAKAFPSTDDDDDSSPQ